MAAKPRLFAALVLASAAQGALASDHLDSPAVIADPRADIGDLYAWTSGDGRQLNLAMTIVGHAFSDRIDYTFHVDSGARFGHTTATTAIVCRFADSTNTDCRVGDADRAVGDATAANGIAGRKHRFRVFAGLRDDPFFNNVRGSRDAFGVAAEALQAGRGNTDAAGCPRFDAATVRTMMDRWRHTEGGSPQDFLAGWTPATIVISVDLALVNEGGNLLAVWATTTTPERQVDRAGRPLTGNALLAPLGPAEKSGALKDAYNQATPATSARFIPDIQQGLALYDGYDGECGNQFLAGEIADIDIRYISLGSLLADDRLWVNSASRECTQLFAVELAALGDQSALRDDCGGRVPTYSAANVFRSLLANGTTTGVDDGLQRDDHKVSTAFPFLAAPDSR